MDRIWLSRNGKDGREAAGLRCRRRRRRDLKPGALRHWVFFSFNFLNGISRVFYECSIVVVCFSMGFQWFSMGFPVLASFCFSMAYGFSVFFPTGFQWFPIFCVVLLRFPAIFYGFIVLFWWGDVWLQHMIEDVELEWWIIYIWYMSKICKIYTVDAFVFAKMWRVS